MFRFGDVSTGNSVRPGWSGAVKSAVSKRTSAFIRLGIAELLLEHYPDEKPAALEHLDFAIAEFREMKMQPSLERALRHKEILGA